MGEKREKHTFLYLYSLYYFNKLYEKLETGMQNEL